MLWRMMKDGMRRYMVAWCYLGGFVAVQGTCLLMSAAARTSLVAFASTSVANLEHDPVGCLTMSAFVTGGGLGGTVAWLPLIAVALCGAVRTAGARRTVGVTAAGHVAGTLVSEGIVAWRVASGALPDSYRHLTDVGPSYVVVSALVLTLLSAPWSWRDRPAWPWRVAAAAGMLLLVYPGQIFSGLVSLDVAAVGHVTTITAALLLRGWPFAGPAGRYRLKRAGRSPPPASRSAERAFRLTP